MADAVLDIAGLEDVAAAVDSDVTGSDDTTVTPDGAGDGAAAGADEGDGAAAGEGDKDGEGDGDGAAAGEGDGKKADKAAEGKSKDTTLPGDKNTPQNIRKTLKAIQDADPSNKEAVKALHGAYERWNAASQVFPKGVQEMKDAKALIDLIGGQEGYDNFAAQKAAVEAIDQKLYSGDPELVSDILEDLKSEGKLEVFPTVVQNFLDRLQKENEDAYFDKMTPHFVHLLETVNINGVLNGLTTILGGINDQTKPEDIKAAITKALGIADKADKWMKNLQAKNKTAKDAEVSPESKKLAEDRKKFEAEKTQFKTNQTKAFQEDVALTSNKADNVVLGKHLGPFLKMPFFKGFTRQNLTPLATTISTNLQAELKADKVYQAQMKALWGAKEPSKEKLTSYHNTKVNDIAERVVRETVARMYPGYAKGGAAAGRVAAAAAKKDAVVKADTAAAQSGKPVYVVSKPKDLIRNTDLSVGGKTYKSSDLTMLEITGKGFVKSADGKSFKLVTWRK